jgi:hypothetical protein
MVHGLNYRHHAYVLYAYNMILANKEGIHGMEDIIGDLQEDAIYLGRGLSFLDLLTSIGEIEDAETHHSLQGDLIEYLWIIKGAELH